MASFTVTPYSGLIEMFYFDNTVIGSKANVVSHISWHRSSCD